MADKGSYITQGEFLLSGDTLTSPSGYFMLFMQGDANVVVQRMDGSVLADSGTTSGAGEYGCVLQPGGILRVFMGSTPPPPNQYENQIWTSPQTPGTAPDYYAILQDDGNFCVYPGTGPDNQLGQDTWAFNKWDPVNLVNVTDINYPPFTPDMISSSEPLALLAETITNSSTLEQTLSFTGTQSTTNSSMWQNSTTLSAKVTMSAECKVPAVSATGKIEASLEVSDTLTFNQTTTKSVSYTWNEGVNAPAESEIKATALVTQAQITVPFTITATLEYDSGATYTGEFNGTYQGANSYDLTFNYSQPYMIADA
jgi:hypothetical protein